MILAQLFTLIVYQPFFNVLVFFYWVLGFLTQGHPDMGIAVIALTLLIRFLLLPISLMHDQSEVDKRQIALQAKELENEFSHDPIELRAKRKALFRESPRVVAGELISLGIQIMISLMLWRIFSTGLEGRDLHLLYPFMPSVDFPYNLVFLGRFDLSHGSLFLNLVQSILIFILETISINASPYPSSRSEVVRMQLVLPVVSFLVFMFLPAGKKLFVITTLCVSIVITTYKYFRRRFGEYKAEKSQAEDPNVEKVVVEVK